MKYQIKIEDQTFEVEIQDLTTRPITVLVDGEPFEVWPEADGVSYTAPPTPPSHRSPERIQPIAAKASQQPASAGAHSSKVYAPIPGVIVSIGVQPGDSVSFGQELCVLEAMKMKNAIRATRSGQISMVNVSIGQQVKHHDVILEYAE